VDESDETLFSWALARCDRTKAVARLHESLRTYRQSWRLANLSAEACRVIHDGETPKVLAEVLRSAAERDEAESRLMRTPVATSLALIGNEADRQLVKLVYLKLSPLLGGQVAGALWKQGDDSLIRHHIEASTGKPYAQVNVHVQRLGEAIADKRHEGAVKQICGFVDDGGISPITVFNRFYHGESRMAGGAELFYDLLVKSPQLWCKIAYVRMIASQDPSEAVKFLILVAEGKIGPSLTEEKER
jgi:hypothetical protein